VPAVSSSDQNKPADPQRLRQARPAQAVEQAQQKSGLDRGAFVPLVAAAQGGADSPLGSRWGCSAAARAEPSR
jgi:hypothetical protein